MNTNDKTSASAAPDPIAAIRELYAHRCATMRQQFRIDNAAGSIVRRAMGWSLNQPEKERENVRAQAAALVSGVFEFNDLTAAGKPAKLPDHPMLAGLLPVLEIFWQGRRPFVLYRSRLEKNLRALAHSLPVWAWAESVKGLGDLGLAIVIGEAGDLSDYTNPGKLWKRLGLAVIGGKAQRKATDPEEAARQGYSPQRRSAVWNITDSLLRQPGPFQDLYRARREVECRNHPEFDKGTDPKTGKRKVSIHCDRRARRYAGKRLILNLWRAWNGNPPESPAEAVDVRNAG